MTALETYITLACVLAFLGAWALAMLTGLLFAMVR